MPKISNLELFKQNKNKFLKIIKKWISNLDQFLFKLSSANYKNAVYDSIFAEDVLFIRVL